MIAGEIVDCLASYFGLSDDGEPNRYFCYHVIGGPGPTPGSGVASIVPVAIYDKGERCVGCQHFHVVQTGGPSAALAKALRYLDAYHEQDRLLKVQTPFRGAAPARASNGSTEIFSPLRRNKK